MRDALDLEIDYPRLVLLLLIILTLGSLVVAGSTSSTAFGVYNSKWDGATDLRATADDAETESSIARNVSAYETTPNGTVAVVLSPDRSYTQSEAVAVRRFVRGGGTLLIAEDYGQNSNKLLSAVGATVRFNGTPVRDEQHNYRSPAMPVAQNVTTHPLTRDVDSLTMNHGTVLEPGNATVLVRTSEFGYLDTNRNEALDANETLDRYPIAAVESVGAGRVIAVADPSLFINAMLERPGNEQFTTNLFASHPYVLLDYSHVSGLPPLALALLVVRQTPVLQFALGLVGLATVGAWGSGGVNRLRRWLHSRFGRRTAEIESTLSSDEIAAYLRQQHPDWSEERIKRLSESELSKRNRD